MNPLNSAASEAPSHRLLETRQTVVDRVFQGLVFVALIAAPVSALRSLTTGWLHAYSLHIALGLMIVAIYWFRHAIPFSVKSALLVLTFWCIGIAGLLTFGIPIPCAGRQTSVGVSIGVALFPDHADDAQSLRRAADAAMYRVKRAGKNQFAFAEREG